MPSFVLGKDAIAYYNTANYAVPTWVAMVNVRDVDLKLTAAKWDGSRRASEWRQVAPTMLEASFTFDMVFVPADAARTLIKTAFLTQALIDLAFSSGPIATTASEYLRADWAILDYSRNEKLEEGLSHSVSGEPGISANEPTYVTV